MDRRDVLSFLASGAAFSPLLALRLSAARSAPPSAPSIEDVLSRIEADHAEHLENIRAFLRVPSVSITGEGMQEGAATMLSHFEQMGFEEAEIAETTGHPAVWAAYDAGAPVTLAVYGMYDVVPVEGQDWSHPPFAAELVDLPMGKAIVARGSNNTKGHLMAFMNAVRSILAARGTLPVNLMFVVEGEEEQGSPSLPQVVARYRESLSRASGMFAPIASQNERGDVELYLGCKGIAFMELECSNERREQGPRKDSSSRFAPVFGSPAWRLIEALETMVDDEGMEVLVDGFYDDVLRTEEDARRIDALLERYDPDVLLSEAGAESFHPSLSERDVLARYVLEPTFNVSGIWGGYTGPGPSTRMPGKATVKIDARLVPNMRSQDIIAKVQAHLDRHSFDDIEIIQTWTTEPYRVDDEAAVVQSLVQTYRSYDLDPMIWPNHTAAAPWHLFGNEPLNLPLVIGGLGHGGNNHAADEYIVVEGKGKIASLPEIEKAYAELLYRFAEQGSATGSG